jgi:hypothetical protein
MHFVQMSQRDSHFSQRKCSLFLRCKSILYHEHIWRINKDTYRWTRRLGRIVFERRHDRGGHFAAYEQPAALVQDLREMFKKDGSAYAAVARKTGYD